MYEYKGFRIKEIHAIVGIDEDDEEGVPAIALADGRLLPLIATDRVRLEELIKRAQEIANKTGRTFKVVRFKERQDIGEIIGEKK